MHLILESERRLIPREKWDKERFGRADEPQNSKSAL